MTDASWPPVTIRCEHPGRLIRVAKFIVVERQERVINGMLEEVPCTPRWILNEIEAFGWVNFVPAPATLPTPQRRRQAREPGRGGRERPGRLVPHDDRDGRRWVFGCALCGGPAQGFKIRRARAVLDHVAGVGRFDVSFDEFRRVYEEAR